MPRRTDSPETFVFDVGVIALSHAATPVSEPALEYVKSAIRGDVFGIIPTTALLGAHHVLRNNYHIKNDVASDLLRNLQTATAIEWYEHLSTDILTESLIVSGEENIDAWDAFYAEVGKNSSADKILTLDDDFSHVDIECEVILDREQFEILREFMSDLDEARGYQDLQHEYV